MDDLSIDTLPLSWACSNSGSGLSHSLDLPLSSATWIPYANVQYAQGFLDFYKQHLSQLKTDYVLRGCPESVAGFLRKNNANCLLTGREAVLDLQNGHMEKEAIKKQVKANHKLGRTREIQLNAHNQKKLLQLKTHARHASKPQLMHVFRDVTDPEIRCFVFEDHHKMWHGVLTIIKRTCHACNVEVILKHQQANFGVMETLIHDVYFQLREEGLSEFSLNEVPFLCLEEQSRDQLSEKEKLILSVGRLMKPVYNYDGLYYFKNKFEPEWRNIYLCASRDIDTLMLTEMAFKMGYVDLAIHQTGQFLTQPSEWINALIK